MAKRNDDRFPPLGESAQAIVAKARQLADVYRGEGDYLHVCVAADGHYFDVFDSSGALHYSELDGRRVR